MTPPVREEPQLRPLSGEIFSPAAATRGAFAAGEIVDADYVTVEPEPPSAEWRRARRGNGLPDAGLGVLRRAQPPLSGEDRRRGGAAFWLFGLAIVAASFWIAGGHALVSR